MLRERMRVLKKLVFVADLCLVALAFQFSVIIDHLRSGTIVNIFSSDNLILPAVIIWGAVFWFSPDCYSVRLRKIREFPPPCFWLSFLPEVICRRADSVLFSLYP
jgi:hypothetical protein